MQDTTKRNKQREKGGIGKFLFEVIFIILPLAFLIRTIGFGLYQVPSGSMETTMLVGERFFADKLSYWFRNPKRGEIISFNEPGASVRYPEGYRYSDNKFMKFWQNYVWGPSNWTKRVIGLPGETVRGVIEDGHPVVYIKNAQGEFRLDESKYINKYPLLLVGSGYLTMIRQLRSKSFNPALPLTSSEQFYRINPMLVERDRYGNIVTFVPNTPADMYPRLNISDEYEITLGPDEYWVMGDNRLGSWDSRGWGPLKASHIHGRIVFRLWSIDSEDSWWIWDLIRNPVDFWKRIRWSRCMQYVE